MCQAYSMWRGCNDCTTRYRTTHHTLCFITAGLGKVEVKDQQIQTEIVETADQHIQAGDTLQQQGQYAKCGFA